MKRAKIGEEAKSRALSADVVDRLDASAASASAEGKRRNIYMTNELLHRAKTHARRKGLSVSTIVRLALDDYLSQHGA